MANLSEVKERLGILDTKCAGFDDRIDKLETLIRTDLSQVRDDLADVIAWMNRCLGWAAAALLIGGAAGGTIVSKLIK